MRLASHHARETTMPAKARKTASTRTKPEKSLKPKPAPAVATITALAPGAVLRKTDTAPWASHAATRASARSTRAT